MKQWSFRASSQEMEDWLNDRENVSGTVQKALRRMRLQEQAVEDGRLTDTQRVAYEWLRESVGVDGRISLGPLKSRLSAQVQVKKQDLKHAVLEPLDRLGYIEVTPRMHSVVLVVRPPEAVESAEEVAPVDDSPRKYADATTPQEVSQGAD